MVFDYPAQPHRRRHGPRGYRWYEAFKPWLRDEFGFRCAYCLLRERWFADGHAAFSIDHLVPQIVAPDQICDYEGLVYVCVTCNATKREQVGVLDPCRHALGEHLLVRADGTIEGRTAAGTHLIRQLQLDRPRLIEYRERILHGVRLLAHCPDALARPLRARWLGFPDDLPDLRKLRPPGGNTRPAGVETCYHVLRERGLLPETY